MFLVGELYIVTQIYGDQSGSHQDIMMVRVTEG